MKAFLSHSSTDKEFVRSVAKELGRQFCLFDEQTFETGKDFKDSIIRALSETHTFVLIASKAAIDSMWVQFELDETWEKKIKGHISSALVFIVDSKIDHTYIPSWLQKAKIDRQNSPKIIARAITSHLHEVLRAQDQKFFIGRLNEINKMQTALLPADGTTAPKAFVVVGLPGIGRRALVRSVSSNSLNLKRSVEIKIDSSFSVADIAIEVAWRVTPYTTREAFDTSVAGIRQAPEEANIERILSDLRTLVRAGELPIFLDRGGMIDDISGRLSAPIESILKRMAPDDEAYLAIVTTRKPADSPVPVIFVDALADADVKLLLSAVGNGLGVKLEPKSIGELSSYIKGYPPGAYFAVRQAKEYGLQVVLADKKQLVDFRTAVFVAHLKKADLDRSKRDVLRLMAAYSPIPLRVIGETLELSAENLAQDIRWLRDRALVTIDSDELYSIAPPVVDAVNRILGFSPEEDAKGISNSLDNLFKENPADVLRPDVLRLVFRAKSLSKEPGFREAFHYTADVINMALNFYHRRDFSLAVEFSQIAVSEAPENNKAHSVLIRALTQLERWTEAHAALEKAKNTINSREYHFLRGFWHRKKGAIESAIADYEMSFKLGRSEAAINREMAQCYLELGRIDEAEKHVSEALRAQPDNRFVNDLAVTVAIKAGNETLARERLNRSAIHDDNEFVSHRRAVLEIRFGNLDAAYLASQQAIDAASKPTFEMLATYVQIAIKKGKLEQASIELEKIDRMNIRSDIRLGLRASLLNASGKFGDALATLDKVQDKDKIVYKVMRMNALSGELNTSALKDSTRSQYEAEVKKLDSELAKLKAADSIVFAIESN